MLQFLRTAPICLSFLLDRSSVMSMNDVLHVVARDHLTLAPDGTPINYINPTSRGTACQIVGLFTLVLAFIIVVLRMGTKTFILRKFGWDDCRFLVLVLGFVKYWCVSWIDTAVLAMVFASLYINPKKKYWYWDNG